MLRFFDSNLISPLLRIYIYLVLSTLRALFSPFCLQCIDLSNGLDLIPERLTCFCIPLFSPRKINQAGLKISQDQVLRDPLWWEHLVSGPENFNQPIGHFQIHPATFYSLFWFLLILEVFIFPADNNPIITDYTENVLTIIYIITEDFFSCATHSGEGMCNMKVSAGCRLLILLYSSWVVVIMVTENLVISLCPYEINKRPN